jgi:hypothetical protein
LHWRGMESTNLLVGSGREVETLGREVEGRAGSEQSDAKLEAAVNEKKKTMEFCDDVSEGGRDDVPCAVRTACERWKRARSGAGAGPMCACAGPMVCLSPSKDAY